MESEYFRVPETLGSDVDSGSVELLNNWIRERGNNLRLQDDDIESLAKCGQAPESCSRSFIIWWRRSLLVCFMCRRAEEETGSEFVEPVQKLIQVATSACERESLEEQAAEDMKISLYLSTLLLIKTTTHEQARRAQAKKKTASTKKAVKESGVSAVSINKQI
jgi:hypothetical protein